MRAPLPRRALTAGGAVIVPALSTVLITGAAGYVGGRLCAALGRDGATVRSFNRDPAPWLGVPETLGDLCTAPAEAIADACRGARAVVHLAGEDELVAAREPERALSQTVLAAQRLAAACATAEVPRLVYLSTVHVYGARMTPGAVLEETLRAEPRSAYAISRLACEHALAAALGAGTELVILRLTNSVGAPADPSVDRWSLVANDLARAGTLTGRLTLRSDGTQWRDFVALAEVCATIAAAAVPGRIAAGTYNLGSGHPRTVRELAGLVQDAFAAAGRPRPALDAPAPAADPPGPYRVAVNRLAAAGLAPGHDLTAAVGETVDFCLRNRDHLR